MKTRIFRPWICAGVLLFAIATQETASASSTIPVDAEVKLTGITGLFGEKQALLVVREPAASGESLGDAYPCTLSEGQSSGPVRVVAIDQSAGRVRIVNGDREQDLTFSRNGVPAPVLSACAARTVSAPVYYTAVPRPAVVYAAPQCVVPQNQLIILGNGGYRGSFSC